MRIVFSRHKIAAAIALATGFMVSPLAIGASPASTSARIAFDIPPQALSDALAEWSRQSGLQIFQLDGNGTQRVNSARVSGTLSPAEALEKMLTATGLTYEFVNDRTVRITPARGDPKASLSRDDVSAVNLAEADQAMQKVETKSPDDPELSERKPHAPSEEITVTGSRLRSVSPTSPLIVITREEMERKGLFTAADVVRSLPQNFSDVNAASTTTPSGSVPVNALGQSAANLRGLGTGATLILVNGRRITGSPVFQGNGTVNLSTIPNAAIERVEVLLDGASAIYGSDALGGVINFILRKDWQGAETSVRADVGVNEGDTREISQVMGATWRTGNVTATLGYREEDPVSARKAGFTTQDYRSRGGNDYRILPGGSSIPPASPGNVSELNGTPLGSLPAGHSGSFTQADLSLANVAPYDTAALAAAQPGTADARTTSFVVDFRQSLTDSVSLFGDFLYSRNRNGELFPTTTLTRLTVPTSNPFNTLGRAVRVDYLVTSKDGIEGMYRTSDLTRINANVGAKFRLPGDWQLEAVGNYSQEERVAADRGIVTTLQAFQNALAGIGPAFNPFTGAHDPALDLGSLIGPSSLDGTVSTELEGGEMSANGPLFSITGGEVSLAVGAQYRIETIDYSRSPFDLRLIQLTAPGIDPVLKRDADVLFAEAGVPVIGARNALPGVRKLLFTLAGRWERYAVDSPDPALSSAEFSATTPRVGVSWQMTDDLRFRGSWSNSFRAPSLVDLGKPVVQVIAATSILDIGHPSGTPTTVVVPLLRGGNIHLQAETTDTVTLGLEWAPPFVTGATISTTYTRIDWVDRIAAASVVTDPTLLLQSDRFPGLAPRDAAGNLLAIVNRPVNLASSLTEVADLDLDYDFVTDRGAFNVGMTAVYTLEANQATSSGAATLETVGTDRGPDELVLSGRFGWSRRNYGLNLTARRSSSYLYTGYGLRFLTNAYGPPYRVGGYTSVDLAGYYETAARWTFNAGIRNLLDRSFPFVDDRSAPYDPSRVDPKGRTLYLQVKKAFDF